MWKKVGALKSSHHMSLLRRHWSLVVLTLSCFPPRLFLIFSLYFPGSWAGCKRILWAGRLGTRKTEVRTHSKFVKGKEISWITVFFALLSAGVVLSVFVITSLPFISLPLPSLLSSPLLSSPLLSSPFLSPLSSLLSPLSSLLSPLLSSLLLSFALFSPSLSLFLVSYLSPFSLQSSSLFCSLFSSFSKCFFL